MTEPQDLLPRHKGDYESLQRLQNLSQEQIMPLIPELLGWLKDGNWPIYKGISSLLLKYTADIQDEILKILKGDDSGWKYGIISSILAKSPTSVSTAIKDELQRIVNFPTIGEMEEDVHDAADDLLSSIR